MSQAPAKCLHCHRFFERTPPSYKLFCSQQCYLLNLTQFLNREQIAQQYLEGHSLSTLAIK